MSQSDHTLYRAIVAHPGIRTSEAARVAGLPIATAQACASRLRKNGHILPPDPARWGQLYPTSYYPPIPTPKLRQYIVEHGPCRASEAIRAVLPNARGREREVAYARIAQDAKEGRLDRLAVGLYDRVVRS